MYSCGRVRLSAAYCQGRLGVDAATAAEVGELDRVVAEQDVFAGGVKAQEALRLNVAVEYSVAVHVLQRFQQLVHVVFDSRFGQVVRTAWRDVMGGAGVPLMASYMFMSMRSKTSASLPVGSSLRRG